MKLFVIVQSALSAGLKIAQALHAFRQFVESYPHLEGYWFKEHNNIVVLQSEDLSSLAERLETEGFRISKFCEPDLNDTLTAICVEPAASKRLSNMPLAR